MIDAIAYPRQADPAFDAELQAHIDDVYGWFSKMLEDAESTDPQPIVAEGDGTPGTGYAVSLAGHSHEFPRSTLAAIGASDDDPADVALAPSPGTSEEYSRGGHEHGLPQAITRQSLGLTETQLGYILSMNQSVSSEDSVEFLALTLGESITFEDDAEIKTDSVDSGDGYDITIQAGETDDITKRGGALYLYGGEGSAYGGHAYLSGSPTGTSYGNTYLGCTGAPAFGGNTIVRGRLFDTSAAYFIPMRVEGTTSPAPWVPYSTGALRIFHDTDDNKIFLEYNDADEGVVSVEMT